MGHGFGVFNVKSCYSWGHFIFLDLLGTEVRQTLETSVLWCIRLGLIDSHLILSMHTMYSKLHDNIRT